MTGRLKWLRTRGAAIVTEDGAAVRLRGVGVGGWLNMENFITGYPGTESAHRRAMREALGERRYELLFDSFLTHFFGSADAAFLASLGLNCVRIPVNYRHWEDDARPGEPRPGRRTTTGTATTRSTSRCSGGTGRSRTGRSRCGRRSAAVRTKKNAVAADHWGMTTDGMRDVLDPLPGRFGREFPGYSPYPFAGCFADASEDECAALGECFAFGNCVDNKELCEVVSRPTREELSMTDRYVPTKEDRFSFGIWTVGWQGVDVFGGEVRPPMRADRAVRKLAELGAYGVNFHDNDVFGFDASAAERDERISAFRKALEETGLAVTTATTNLFGHPMFKDGAFTANEREVRRFALAKVMRNLDLAAELGAQVYVFWGGREGAESGAAKDVRVALDRYAEGLNLLSQYVIDQGYGIRFAIEPKPNEPRGDILLPTVGNALAFINSLEHPEMVGVNPEIGHEEMAGLNYAHSIAQALWHGKLFHIDLNGQNGPRYDQDLRFGAGNVRGAFWVVDTLLAGGYAGPVHFDYKPPRTEDDEGVWVSAAACMRNYLILREKARAFRADPEVQEALRAARIPELSEPTLAPGETWRDVRDAAVDADALGRRGMGYERLDQLAMEHLFGVR